MIEVEHLSKSYGSTQAIEDVTFSVDEGEILGFLGPNGAGKTTTMRILSGYLPASQGQARIASYEVHENSMAVRQRIGYLPESPPLYPEMTVEGFLNFVAKLKGLPAGDRPQRVNSALERCNLAEKRQVFIRKLSKGFRQRVGIAQAIVHDPPVIILDEPTVGLDPRQIIEVRNLIKGLAGSHTIILSTHILPEVNMTCNRVAIINRGRIVATDTLDKLMEQTRQGVEYELEVDGKATTVAPTLRSLLQEIQGIRQVDLLPAEEMSADRQRLQVICEPGVEPGAQLAAVVIGAGMNLYEMRRTRVSLEDVFLQLTTEEKTETDVSESSQPSTQEAA